MPCPTDLVEDTSSRHSVQILYKAAPLTFPLHSVPSSRYSTPTSLAKPVHHSLVGVGVDVDAAAAAVGVADVAAADVADAGELEPYLALVMIH